MHPHLTVHHDIIIVMQIIAISNCYGSSGSACIAKRTFAAAEFHPTRLDLPRERSERAAARAHTTTTTNNALRRQSVPRWARAQNVRNVPPSPPLDALTHSRLLPI